MTVIHQDHNGLYVVALKPEAGLQHDYLVTKGDYSCMLEFQNGPVPLKGINGLTNEALLAILIHRTTHLDSQFPCQENKEAIEYMELALEAFDRRTKQRIARNVEGKRAL